MDAELNHHNTTGRSAEQEIPFAEESLRLLYQKDEQVLSDAEQQALTPILNSLVITAERYTELEPIAEGGEKKITRVYDSSLGRSVAMARAVRGDADQDQEDFLREARLTAGLEHPNIVTIHNIGRDVKGVPFFTMELLPGDSLKDIIDRLRAGDSSYRKQYSLNVLLGIFQKICDAVAYAHSRRVLHLDLKPENIRVGPYGEVFVCDWGLAKVMSNTPTIATVDTLDGDLLNDISLSGTIQGTPGFMAPEQGQADTPATEAMDIYSLGSMLYMILTHELPVEGKSSNDILENTQTGKTIQPRRRKPGMLIPKSVATVAMKALERQPQRRYAKVVDLRDEIQRFLSGFTTHAEKAGPATRVVYTIRRHSRGALMVMLFMMVLMGIFFSGSLRIRRERDIADTERKQAEENLALFIAEQNRSERLGSELGEVVEIAGASADMINAKTMLGVLDKGLGDELDIKEKNLLLQNKAMLLFILQEFNAARDCFSQIKNPGRLMALQELSTDYARRKSNDKDLLSERDLADLLIIIRQEYFRFRNDQTAISQYIYFHHMQRRGTLSPEEYMPLASVMLDHLNDVMSGALKPLKLTKQEDGYHLDLSGKYYIRYRLDIMGGKKMNVLKPFGELESLDISHTPLFRISEIGGARARKLRMVGLDLVHPHAAPGLLKYVHGLRQVTIDLHRYPPKTQEELKQKYRVVVE